MTSKTYRLLGADRQIHTSTAPGTLGGNTSTHIYGRLDCPTALRAIARGGYVSNRVFFADSASAIAAGYRPCGVCCKAEYAIWKRGQNPTA